MLAPLDEEARRAASDRWATRAKPAGSLGRLEAVAAHLAAVTGRCPPDVPDRPAVVVFAADHGVVGRGVSAWPSSVTAAMVATMAAGRAAVSALAATVGATVEIIDVGVAGSIDVGVAGSTDVGVAGSTGPAPVVDARVRPGTADLAAGPAMERTEAEAALEVGADAARRAVSRGADLLVAGDMGIGNTTAATCLVSWACGVPAADAVGPGAGLPEERLAAKVAVVEAAVGRVLPDADPVAALAEVGGLEIAAVAGFYAEAARLRVPVVADGVITLAGLLVADRIEPGTAARVLAGHRSTEPGASLALAFLGLEPLLDLGMRLGEGTGAVLAVPLVRAAARALRDMADLPGG